MTEDKRFVAVNDDPRFKRQKKKASRVKIDARFKGMFDDEQFVAKGTVVDKYGRRVAAAASGAKSESEKLKEYYELEDSEGSVVSDEGRVSGEECVEEKSVNESEQDSEQDSESEHDSTEEYLMDQVMSAHPLVNTQVDFGEASRRLALVNMDWDHIKAVDILTFCSAFKPPTGTILSVTVYPSEFGKERLAREAVSGPIIDTITAEDDETKQHEPNADANNDYDEIKLRKYQLERLKYYYAVIECDRVETAQAIYVNCDGREFEQSGNVVDLRYVPDDTDFTSDAPTDVARPGDATTNKRRYLAKTDLSTAALQTSSVKLTWDMDDPDRARLTRQAVTAGLSKRERRKLDVRDVDLAAYLASASSDSDSDAGERGDREEYRRRLLSANKEGDVFGRQSRNGDSDLKVVFSGAFDTSADGVKADTMEEEEREDDIDAEYTFTHDGTATTTKDSESDSDELTVFQRQQQKRKQKMAEKRAKRRAALKQQAAATKSATAAELSALMRHSRCATDDPSEVPVDTGDQRFAAIYDQPDYAIDPSAPGFKRTAGMQALLEERSKRRRH